MKCGYCFIKIKRNGKLKGYMIADKEHVERMRDKA